MTAFSLTASHTWMGVYEGSDKVAAILAYCNDAGYANVAAAADAAGQSEDDFIEDIAAEAVMTHADFVQSKVAEHDLRKNADCGCLYEDNDQPVAGLIYRDGFHIMVESEGVYVLTLENDQWVSADLADLESRLYEFAVMAGGLKA